MWLAVIIFMSSPLLIFTLYSTLKTKKQSSLSRYRPFLEGPVSQLVNASGAQTFVFSKTLIGMSVCSVKLLTRKGNEGTHVILQ